MAARPAELNRFAHLTLKKLRTQARALLRGLARQIARQIAQLDALIVVVLGHVPELGTLCRREAAHLFGLAPFDRDSGQKKGARHIAGGRAAPRSALYMAAMVASVHNRFFKAFDQRLRSAGKLKKVALVAVMRKLACLLKHLFKYPDFVLAD